MERERSQRREGAATWLWMPKEKQRTTSTKRRVNRNMLQNRLGRTQKPDTNLLLCFKASSVHPPPSYPFRIFPPPPRYEIVLCQLGLDVGQADGCSACSPAASCFLRKRGCTCPCPSSCGRGSGMCLWVPSSPPPARPANSPDRKVAGEEEKQGDRECWRVELGGLILHIVNHYLPHNLFLFSRGFTGTHSQKHMRNMWQTAFPAGWFALQLEAQHLIQDIISSVTCLCLIIQ